MKLAEKYLLGFAETVARELVSYGRIKKPLRSFKVMHRGDKCHDYYWGWCDDLGNIRIRLKTPKLGRLVTMRELVLLVCHEVAHLVPDVKYHGDAWRSMYDKLKQYAVRRYL